MNHRMLALLLLGTASPAATRLNLDPGNYEIDVTVKVEGLPAALPDQRVNNKKCVTEKDLQGERLQTLFSEGNPCKITELKLNGSSSATWKMSCSQGIPTTGSGKITYEKTSYHGEVITTSQLPTGKKLKSTAKFKGKRLGSC